MTQTFLDVAQADELVAMYVGGKAMQEIAEHFGVHRATVATTSAAGPCGCGGAN